LLHLIIKNFISLYKSHNKIISADVITAVAVEKSTRDKIIELVKRNTDFDVELEEKVNPEIIGGSIINIGDYQLDNSVQTQLKNLKNNYNKNLFIKDL
jgi:F-type H+-transporting ATPase subunit delta